MADILGTINGETIDGTADADTIHAGDGDDIVNGLGGDDQLYGEIGNDTLNGGDGADALRGGPGNDSLHGDAGDDFLVGGGGNDLLDGGAGEDRISLFDPTGTFGVTVDLRLDNVAQDFGPFGVDTLVSIEQVIATYGNDTLIGNDVGNWFWTFGGNDTLSGNGGDDYFTVGDQDKVIDGGTGSDTVEIDDSDAYFPLYGQAGVNVSLLLQGQSQSVGTGNWILTNIENLSGNWGNDTFTGDANDNILAGGTGNDTLNGGGGNDTLLGDGAIGIGFDPANPNSYSFISVLAPATFAPGNDVLTGGNGDDTLFGGGGNDQLRGNADNDTIYGGDGDDDLLGGPGNDLLDGGAGDDVANLFDPSGTFGITLDLRLDGVAQDLGPLGVDTLVSIEQVWSTYGNDNLTGNESNNWFWTYGGNDTLSGNGGDDYFTVGDQDKVVDGGAGSDTVEFDDSDAYNPLYTAAGVNVSLLLQGQSQAVGTGNWTLNSIENLSGNWGNDTFTGDANNNTLAGGTGNDTLDGGDGDDVLLGDGAMLYGYDLSNPNRFRFAADVTFIAGLTAGNDVLHGGTGNDALYGGPGDDALYGDEGNDSLVVNGVVSAASVLDGGADFNVLSVVGETTVLGSLVNIEGIFLQSPDDTGVYFTPDQLGDAYLEMDLAHFAMLPAGFSVGGVGVIDPDINQGESFDFSSVVFEPGSNVMFYFDGESDTPGPAVTWVGTSNGDVFDFGSDIITATGGGGADLFQLSGSNATVVDFTIGEDKIDLTETGVDTAARLLDFTSQVGNDVVIAAQNGDDDPLHFVLQNIQLADLSEEDVIFAAPGGSQNDPGTALGDIMFGYADNDVFHGGDGNDRIYGGGGTDAIYGDAGDDTVILDGLVTGGTYDGGTGTDTLELRTTDVNNFGAFGSSSAYTLYSTTLSGIEQIRFGSEADTGVTAQLLFGQVAPSGVMTLIGGEGRDSMVVIAASPTGGTFTMPNFNVVNWTSSPTPGSPAGDAVVLVAGSPGNFTLNAREGLAGLQAIIGGGGNDILNGSSAADILDGAGGVNVINGNGGDDVLVIANTVNPQGQPTTLTGAGSAFNGGDGFDSLWVGGHVDFAGTLSGVEAFYLQPEYTTPAPLGAGSQEATVLSIDGSLLASLPANLAISGTGTIDINLGAADHYDASAWTVAAGSSVAVNVIGSDGDDTMVLGAFAENVTGGDSGIDTAVFAGNSTDYVVAAGSGTSLTIGDDTLDGVALFQFADGVFFWNGTSLVSAVNDGLVADGYVAGATVYIDANNNGVLDSGEPSTITDANGDFTLVSPFVGPIRAFGGTNIDTGLPNTIQFSATEGSTVINPLTTLVQSLVESGQAADAAAAQTAVKTAFGIDPSIDLANVDLIDAATNDPGLALSAHQAAASVAAVLSVVNNVGGDTQAALNQLTTIVAGGGSVDLTDSATLTQVVGSGVTGGTVDVTSVVTVVQGDTQAIGAATSVSEVTAAQVNYAPTVTADAGSLFEDGITGAVTRAAGVLGNDTDPDTGETALLRVTQVTGADPAGTAVATTGTTSIAGDYGTLQIAADGTYSYSADLAAADALAAGATASEVFTYKIVDPSGQQSTTTLTLTVTGVDDAAVAQNDAFTTTEDASLSGSLFADHGSGADNDVDGPALAIAAVNGDAASVGTQITLTSGALLTVNADGTYSYDPNHQFDDLAQFGSGAANTTGSDTFTYTLAGGGTATVTIDIHGVASTGDRMGGTAGDDTIAGTGGNDILMLQDGGEDSVGGGDGNDGFYMGAELSFDDHLDGGAGPLDQVGIQGADYGSRIELHELGPDNVLNVEELVLLSGSDTRFGDTAGNLYSYYLQENDANVAAGQRFYVNWNTLQVGEDVIFDGSAESDGKFITFGGLGNDTVIGGQQNDGFYFGYGLWGAGDSVDGQGGTLDQLGLQGNYTAAGTGPIVFGADQMTGIEMIVLLSGGDDRFGAPAGQGYSYDLTMNDGNVSPGGTMYISANTLMAADGVGLLVDETLTFDGSAEHDGSFIVFSGDGGDTITGGDGADTIYGAGGADALTGGAGDDLFVYGSADHSTASAMDQILDFASGDRIDLSSIDTGSGDGAFTFIGSAAFGDSAGELRAYEQTPGHWMVEGDIDGNGTADLVISVTVTDAHALSAGDLVL